ncbi:P-loop containing nucleoside triphosphate hydrolase protein [Earliella scabrosa]|nr:P-loop containing nucleoside triphosphate hydrolase protein [Earliella scabrosa]
MRRLCYPRLLPVVELRLRNGTATRNTSTITLQPYQEECLDACLKAIQEGRTRIGVSLPTGSGKTTIFLHLLSRLCARHRDDSDTSATQSLVLVNSVELAQRTSEQAKTLFPEWTVEIEQGAQYASGEAHLTIATWQTLSRTFLGSRLDKFIPRSFKAVVVDEAHHAVSPSYLRILSHFCPAISRPHPVSDAPAIRPHPYIIGFSATFSRNDRLALGTVFEEVVYHRDLLNLIEEKWLCDVRFTVAPAEMNLSRVSTNWTDGDFNATQLAEVVNTDDLNEEIVRVWRERAGDRKSTLVFCVNIAHVQDVTAAFREAGIDARFVYGRTAQARRQELVEAFRAGEFPVMVNCGVFTEGTDIPNIDCVIIARPTRSRNLFTQMIGRGMRLSPETGKEDCHIIDLVDSQERVGGVMNVPSLLGLRPSEVTNGKQSRERMPTCDEVLGELAGHERTAQSTGSMAYLDPDKALFMLNRSGKDILGPFAWVPYGDNVYILDCMRGYVVVEPLKTLLPFRVGGLTFTATHRIPFKGDKSIVRPGLPLLDALVRSEQYIQRRVLSPSQSRCLLRSADWRNRIASLGQVRFVREMLASAKGKLAEIGLEDSELTDDVLSTMTMGEISTIITRLKYSTLRRRRKNAS